MDGNTYRKNADTVPSVAVHYYYRSHLKDYSTFWDGIVIYADDGQIIRNFPKQHIANGKAKNNQTKYYYKRMVRIIKKMRYLMSDLGYACANNVSSFGLESLLWNLPDSCFTKWTNYGFAFEEIVDYLYKNKYDLFGYAGEAVGLATVIMAAYERWLWRINPFETTPALKKIYTGKIVSSYDNIERPIELYIKQSLLSVQITMVSAESRSNSLSASVTGINGENSLIYHYLNTPQSKYRDRSEVHYGTAVLTIIDGTMLKGRYYTDRKTNGDIELIVKE